VGTIVDHVMHANKKSLEAIFQKSADRSKTRAFGEACAIHLEGQLKLNLGENVVSYCFGMCQETNVADSGKSHVYTKLSFLEFVEFLCRLLYTRFSIDMENSLQVPDASKVPVKEKMDGGANLFHSSTQTSLMGSLASHRRNAS